MLELDFLALVLQSSNSFDLKAFFNFSSVYSSWLQGPSPIVAFKGRVFHGVVWSRLEVFFFRLKSSNCFHVETHIFGRSFIFCYFCLCLYGFEFAPARGIPAGVSNFLVTSQDAIKIVPVRI